MRALWILAVLGCGGPPTAAPPLAHHTQPAPAPVASVHPSCMGDLPFHRETLPHGRETEIAAMDHRATFQGEQLDHFDDGTSAVMLSLEIFGQPWLPDVRDRGVHAFGDHCVRLVEANANEIVLDVALQPAHVYDAHRCQMGCCRSEAQSRAPDGSEECCFCTDDPTP